MTGDRRIKRIGVTGATGAIGLALTEKCLKQGIEVYVFLRRGSKRNERIADDPLVHKVYCGLEEMAEYDTKDIPELDILYHFAWMKAFGEEARDDLKTQIKNIEYAVDSVNLAKRLGCRRYIGAGSQAEYGRHTEALGSGTPCLPETGYGMAKLAAGQMTGLACRKLGLEHIWTRVLSIYGPGDGEGTLVMSVIRDALAGRNPECTKAEQIWDYMYSGDAADAFLALGENGVSGRTYVMGSGKAAALREYIDEICAASAEISGSGRVKPGYGAKPYGDRQVMYLKADISGLAADTGYRPQTSFEDGIRKTAVWVKENMSK